MMKEIKIKSEIKNLRIVEKIVDEIATEMNISRNCYGKLMVGTMEAVNNAVIHGNKGDGNKEVKIFFEYGEEKVEVTVEDQGGGFKYNEIPDPTLPENLEKITGRGIFLMKKLADDIKFNETGNRVTLVFKNIK